MVFPVIVSMVETPKMIVSSKIYLDFRITSIQIQQVTFVNVIVSSLKYVPGDIISFKENEQFAWRTIFVIGILIGPFVYIFMFQDFKSEMITETVLLIQAGLLVGLGTSIGSGCTSGHGICGIARLSIRSIVATFIFVIFGILTVYFIGGKP